MVMPLGQNQQPITIFVTRQSESTSNPTLTKRILSFPNIYTAAWFLVLCWASSSDFALSRKHWRRGRSRWPKYSGRIWLQCVVDNEIPSEFLEPFQFHVWWSRSWIARKMKNQKFKDVHSISPLRMLPPPKQRVPERSSTASLLHRFVLNKSLIPWLGGYSERFGIFKGNASNHRWFLYLQRGGDSSVVTRFWNGSTCRDHQDLGPHRIGSGTKSDFL